MKKEKILSVLIMFLISFFMLTIYLSPSMADESDKTILFHLKTSLKKDDAQICVTYNMIWAALDRGLKVNVLIDASAVNTYAIRWFGKDSLQDYDIPERLRRSLSVQFNVPIKDVPRTYGEFLNLLHKKGANFYINTAFLVLAKIEDKEGSVENISAKFFKPVSLKKMLKLRTDADYYMVY